METPSTEIILLNLNSLNADAQPRFNRFPGRPAPLGLCCLAAVAPERIAVIDGANPQQLFDQLATIEATAVKAVICQIAAAAGTENPAGILTQVRKMFPGALLGVSTERPELPTGFDFASNGTGKAVVLRILRGDRPSGFLDTRDDDFASPLPIPQEPMTDCGYEILPEKWLFARTLEIFQPWLGLLDQSGQCRTYPGIDWFANLVSWLQRSGFAAFHLRPSGLTSENLHELRSVMLNLKARFAVSFLASDHLNIRQIGAPLQQVWLYNPTAASVADTREKLQQIRETGFQACLQIDRHWFADSETQPLIKLVERIAISDESHWSFADLKKFTARFWGSRNRFFRRLFGLKSASELVMFLKTSYMVLEIMFTSEKKAGA